MQLLAEFVCRVCIVLPYILKCLLQLSFEALLSILLITFVYTRAANTIWDTDIFEYYCVDTSSHMNDLARLLVSKGEFLLLLLFLFYYTL